jgi:hypothetical protein
MATWLNHQVAISLPLVIANCIFGSIETDNFLFHNVGGAYAFPDAKRDLSAYSTMSEDTDAYTCNAQRGFLRLR